MRDRSTDRRGFAEFTAKLAAELGISVTRVGEHGFGTRIGGVDGEPGYFVNEPWNAARRVEVTGVYPKSDYWCRTRPSITAAMSRGPVAVAGDIRRRLEPGYLEVLAQTNAYNEQAARDAHGRERTAAAIEALFPGQTHRVSHRQTERSTTVAIGNFGLGGDVKMSGAGAETWFEGFRVPAEAGLEMLAAYAAWRDRQAA